MASGDDLATLSELDENIILAELHTRYKKDIIYTYIGDILIAVNPYKTLPIYEKEKCTEYTQIGVRSTLPPHIFAISDTAYHNMIRTATNQCCVVSGESGAGKTESTKLLIQHIAHLCSNDSNDLNSRIVQVNPLMEAFGNAQTVLNYNSSRFGKYIELMFDRSGQLAGAKISEYLLEKSRVVSQNVGERNFHIFYYLFAGLDEERMNANLLKRPEEHRIVSQVDGGPVFPSQADNDRCKRRWETLMGIMADVGFSSETVDGILAILAAIVHIGDIEFESLTDVEGVQIKNDNTIVLVSQLLVVTYDKLLEALISTVTTVGGADETVTVNKTEAQASDGRDALGKALYGRLFSWIVVQINEKLGNNKDLIVDTTIGILDIYGFENFANNSFEQLCINITNEQLQCFFNEHIFRWELEEYEREGISGSDITYVDNQKLLDFFLEPMKPMGLLALLDDEVRIPCGNDQGFIDKLTKSFSALPDFKRPKGQQMGFMIQHFAGQVTYNVDGFLEKNRDTLSENFRRCMRLSEARLVFELFSPVSDLGHLNLNDKNATIRRFNRKSRMFLQMPDLTPQISSNRMSRMIKDGQLSSTAGNRARPGSKLPPVGEGGETRSNNKTNTLGNQFKNSLQLLMKQLKLAEPHFVRCVKPNKEKAASSFNAQMVTEQLRYTGVLETVKIRKQGYPTRLAFVDFMQRYRFITFTATSCAKPDGPSCRRLLESAGLENWQIGHSKIFLKYYHVEQLNTKLTDFARRVAVCQNYLRGFVARRKYEQLLKAAKEFKMQAIDLFSLVQKTNDLASSWQNQWKLEDAENQRAAEERAKEIEQQRTMEMERKKKEEEQREIEDRKRKEDLQREKDARKKQEDEQKGGTSRTPPTNTPAEKAKVRMRVQPGQDPIGTITAVAPTHHPPIPDSMLPSIQEDALCPPDCDCLWKGFPLNISGSSSGGPPDTAETLLSDTLPKLSEVSRPIWAKIFVMERNALIAKFYLNSSEVVIDDSSTPFTGSVCGLRNSGFVHLNQDPEVTRALDSVKEGVKVIRESDGSISMVRLCATDVSVRVSQNSNQLPLSKEIRSIKGVLRQNTRVKVFDMLEYKRSVANLLRQVTLCDPYLFCRMCVFDFSFGRESAVDTDTPLWIVLVHIAALDILGSDQVLTEILDTHLASIGNSHAVTLKKNWQHLRCQRPAR